MKFYKIISVILAVLMLTAVFSACTGNGSASLPSSVDEDGRFIYSVVRSGETTIPVVEDAAKELRNKMKDNFDCKITITKDTAYEDFDGNYEILVGSTNRAESDEAIQRIIDNRENSADDFIVAVINDKIVINAMKDEMVPIAVEWFINTFCQSLDTWALLKEDYQFIYAPEVQSSEKVVAGANLGTFAVVLPRAGSYMAAMGVETFADIYSEYGYSTEIIYDFEEAKEYEILLGNCNREESKAVSAEGDNYVIKVVGKKLVIKGGNDLATYTAFNTLLSEVASDKGFNWSDGYTINGKYDPEAEGTYTLNWYDEFEGTSIDFTKWGDYRNQALGDKPSDSCLGGKMYWSNVFGESLCESDYPTIHQADGKMIIPSARVSDTDFIGASASTYWTMTYKYGILEIQGKLPENPATVSYWVNGASITDESFAKRFGTNQTRVCMVEVDLLENFGRLNSFASNVHRWWSEYDANGEFKLSAHKSMDGNAAYTGNSTNNKKYNYDPEKFGDNIHDNFHNYAFYWDDKCMKFAFDGVVYCTYEYKDNDSASVHCLMDYFLTGSRLGSASYGETFDKDIHGDYYEHQMEYVRIYQTDAINSQMITAWPQKQENGTSTVMYPENTVGRQY